eukprot:9524353-Lingulodinium_polyedra.AAC.1
MSQLEEQCRAERFGFEERAVHAYGGMEQTAEGHGLVARARVEEVNELSCHLQDATMNVMRVIEEAGQLRHQ